MKAEEKQALDINYIVALQQQVEIAQLKGEVFGLRDELKTKDQTIAHLFEIILGHPYFKAGPVVKAQAVAP